MKNSIVLFVFLLMCNISSSFAVTVMCFQDHYRENPYDSECAHQNQPHMACNWSVNHQNATIETLGESDNPENNRVTNNIHCTVIDMKKGRLTKESVKLKLHGVGAGLRWTSSEELVINCPFVTSVERLTKHPFFGVKVAAGFLVGADVGLFVNKRGGSCVLSGVQLLSFGAGISGAKLEFLQK